MRIAFIDGSAGMSGDMTLGALVHAGWPFEELLEVPLALGLKNVRINKRSLNKKGVSGTKIDIETPHEHGHRHLDDITNCIERSGLEVETQRRAIAVFQRVAKAESIVHGVPIDEIHFHEVGAVDAMVDIVGSCRGIVRLGIEKVVISPLRLGSGFVKCAHGELPIPAPATSILIKGLPCFAGDTTGEWTTPTGAALAAEWSGEFGQMPMMTIESEGWGAGQADPGFPNLLRLIVGDNETGVRGRNVDQVSIVETEIDDMQGEYYSYLGKILSEVPVKDYYFTPVIMKKGRPGQLITVLVDEANVDRVVNILFRETTTFGIRVRETERYCLERRFVSVHIYDEDVRVKVGEWNKDISRISPEYEDCRRIAEKANLSLDDVYFMARTEAKKLLQTEGF